MASRHQSRSLVLQTLFECDMQSVFAAEMANVIFDRDLKEFSRGTADVPFAESLLKNVLGKREELDAVMVKAAPEWPLEHIAPIDRNVLRIGLYELLFGDHAEVPPKVALNEAIELAKSYGGDTSGKFVNGVLGSVYRSLGEPGKEKKAELPIEQMAGIVAVSLTEQDAAIALVKDAFGKWTFPKTKCANGESLEAASIRAAKEKMGLEVRMAKPLSENQYTANDPEGRVSRVVSYFLSVSSGEPPLSIPTSSSGIEDARWFKEEELATIEMYGELMPLARKSIEAAREA